jgi:hypothetical protein
VHAQDLIIDQGCNRKTVKAVRECLPQLDREPPLALVVEAIDSVNARTLMVASQKEEVLRVFDLVRKHQADCFE